MNRKSFREEAPMWAALSLAVLYLAVLGAGVYADDMNLFQFMAVFPEAMNKPFALRWTPHTLKFMLGALVIYPGAIAVYYSSRMNRRPGVEHGSAPLGQRHRAEQEVQRQGPGEERDPYHD